MREEEKRLAKLEEEVAVLRAIVAGQAGVLDGICAALVRREAVPIDELIEAMQITTAFVSVTRSRAAAIIMLGVLETLGAIAKNPQVDPLRTMASFVLLDEMAGEDQREALHTWIEQATATELVQEILPILERLRGDLPD